MGRWDWMDLARQIIGRVPGQGIKAILDPSDPAPLIVQQNEEHHTGDNEQAKCHKNPSTDE